MMRVPESCVIVLARDIRELRDIEEISVIVIYTPTPRCDHDVRGCIIIITLFALRSQVLTPGGPATLERFLLPLHSVRPRLP